MTPTLYSHHDLQGLCPGWEIEHSNWRSILPRSTAEMHITHAVSFINILRITVYHKWALRLKVVILDSQKFHRTKFLSSKKWRNSSLFWPWVRPIGNPGLGWMDAGGDDAGSLRNFLKVQEPAVAMVHTKVRSIFHLPNVFLRVVEWKHYQ